MMYSMSVNQGYLAPGQSKNISLSVITKSMGRQKCVLRYETCANFDISETFFLNFDTWFFFFNGILFL